MNRTTLVYMCLCLWMSTMGVPAAPEVTFPQSEWKTITPQEAGMDAATLQSVADYCGGRGFVSRYGYQVFTWGDYDKRGDVASAAKPFYSHLLFMALEKKLIPSLDQPVSHWEPRLAALNPELNRKDSRIHWRHLANQTSCYGVSEEPGTAFDYNDWQMALFWDLLFLKVYSVSYDSVDEKVLHSLLTDRIQCEDNPTFMAFGMDDRPGRTAISPRDSARFGLLYLNQGRWNDEQIISKQFAVKAVTEPLSASLPRAGFTPAAMLEGQRSIGSKRIPDNQCEHEGSYSWLWWVNGVNIKGERHWPDAPNNTFAALGHGGKRGMAVLPDLDIVISWNDTRIDEMQNESQALNGMFQRLMSSLEKATE